MDKIRALGLESYFDEIAVLESFTSETGEIQLKKVIERFSVHPSRVVMVGTRVFSEIKCAKHLGQVTVRVVQGKYSTLLPTDQYEKPDYQIKEMKELIPVLKLVDQRLVRPKIVALGGGTGLAVLLKELRNFPADLTAVVTVFDSGRHSGQLRKSLGILPPGDIRNCLVALSNEDDLLKDMMNYRFKGDMEGTSLGNLLLAALTDILGGFDKAVKSISKILNIGGRVLPATLDSTEICAELQGTGEVVVSEVNVRDPCKSGPIKRIFLEKEDVTAFPLAVQAIIDADIIIISPGGFYTSILSHFLVPGIRKAILKSHGALIYVSNLSTQRGQTDGYTLEKTISILSEYLGSYDRIDYVIANNAIPPAVQNDPQRRLPNGETMLLPTAEMAKMSRPVLVAGCGFVLEESNSTSEWQKAPMVKHNGEMVVGMLYHIIEREMDGVKRDREHFFVQDLLEEESLQEFSNENKSYNVLIPALVMAVVISCRACWK